MKKTTRIFGILLIAAMLLATLALSASATPKTDVGPFTVQITNQVYTNSKTGVTANFGTDRSTFTENSYSVVNSTTITFTYRTWVSLKTEGGIIGDQKTGTMTVTLNDYSCDRDISETVSQTYAPNSNETWTFNFVITKSAGHVYDNSCDASCNLCGETRTVTHDYQNSVCTLCGGVCTHNYDATGLCDQCNVQAVASVTMGSTTQYYVDIQDVVTAVKEATARPYVKLLANITLTDTLNFKNAPQGMELDFAGKTIYNPNGTAFGWGIAFTNDNGLLALRDSVGGGGATSGRFDALDLNNDAVIYGGTYKASMDDEYTQAAAVSVYRCAVTIYGGVFDSTDSAVMANSGTVLIYGGSFVNTTGTFDARGTSLIQVYAAEFPNGIFKETSHREYAVKLADVLAPDCYLKDAEGNLVSTEGNVYAVNGACTISAGADLAAAVVTVEGTYAYNGLEQKPADVTVTIHGRTVDPAYYTVTYANNITVGTEAVVTVTGKVPYTGSNSATFEIVKGELKADTNPETTYEFGATYTDVVTGGKVVIVGNESAVVTGTWTWAEPGQTAVFTPDAQYEGLFNELTNVSVNHVVTPAAPVIEVITPSPSIMPGMAIRMSIVVKNPHNEELTDLPTAFRVTYRIGENGSSVTADGLEFTLPTSGVVLGDKVYVTVENVAVEGKYSVATSVNTVELAVGQVDYTAAIKALEEQITALEESHGADVSGLRQLLAELQEAVAKLDENGYATDAELAEAKQELLDAVTALAQRVTTLETTYATIEALNTAKQQLLDAINANETDIEEKVAALNQALEDAKAALEQAYKAADDALKATLEQQISDAETELNAAIEKVKTDLQAALAAAVEALEKADKDNAEALAAAIENLNKAIEAAKQFATDEDAKLKEALEAADAALDAAIKLVQENLDKAVENLEQADKTNAEALAAAIEQLSAAIEAAEAAAEAGDAAVRSELAAAEARLNASISNLAQELEKAKTDLMNAILAGDADLAQKIEKVRTALNAAIAANNAANIELTELIYQTKATLQNTIATLSEELNAAIAAGDADLDQKITALQAALDAAMTASDAADEALKQEMKNAVATLNAAVNQVQKNLNNAKEELVAQDQIMTAELQRQNTFLIVVCVIASVGMAGCMGLVAYIVIDKRKPIR